MVYYSRGNTLSLMKVCEGVWSVCTKVGYHCRVCGLVGLVHVTTAQRGTARQFE